MTPYAESQPPQPRLVTYDARAFVDEECVRDLASCVERARLRSAYHASCERRGLRPQSARALAAAVRALVGDELPDTTSVWTDRGPRRAWAGVRLVSVSGSVHDAVKNPRPLERRLDELELAPAIRVCGVAGIGAGLVLGTCAAHDVGDVPNDLRRRWGSAVWITLGLDELLVARRALEAMDVTRIPHRVQLSRPAAAIGQPILLRVLVTAYQMHGALTPDIVADEPRRDLGSWTFGRLLSELGVQAERVEVLVDGGWREVSR